MISKEALDEFKTIWRKEFGTDISDAEALKRATNLLRLYRAVLKPVKEKYLGEHQK